MRTVLHQFLNQFVWLSDIHITKMNMVEIFLMACVLYMIAVWLLNSRAGAVFKGILLVLIVYLVAEICEFKVMSWILSGFWNIGIIAILIIFQKEIRKFFENMGRMYSLPFFNHKKILSGFTEDEIDEIVYACKLMSGDKTGSLMVLKRNVSLDDYLETGIPIRAEITHQLLVNIFEHNTPLHDGAVVLQDHKIESATCYLPLTERLDVDKVMGTRHRAAIGVSEETDAFVIVVSEETGSISSAYEGRLTEYSMLADLRRDLMLLFGNQEDNHKIRRFLHVNR